LKLITVEISFMVLFLRFFETFHYGALTLRYQHIPITSPQPFPSRQAFLSQLPMFSSVMDVGACRQFLPHSAPVA